MTDLTTADIFAAAKRVPYVPGRTRWVISRDTWRDICAIPDAAVGGLSGHLLSDLSSVMLLGVPVRFDDSVEGFTTEILDD